MTRTVSTFILLGIGLLLACSKESSEAYAPVDPAAPDSTTLRIARTMIAALNAGDADAAGQVLATDAQFNRAGTVFDGRTAIVNNFFRADVVATHGQYQELRATSERGRSDVVTIEFNYRAGSVREHFTYRFTIRNGLIQEVIGRYV